jgi:hypothetical protein
MDVKPCLLTSLTQRNAMAIEDLHDVSHLSVVELYAVYVGIAESDLNWRRRAMYGDTQPPPGHSEFRPIPFDLFDQRFMAAQNTVGGETRLRQRLSRQAAAYRVDIDAVVSRIQQAA